MSYNYISKYPRISQLIRSNFPFDDYEINYYLKSFFTTPDSWVDEQTAHMRLTPRTILTIALSCRH